MIFALLNQKGGVGKTTLAVHVETALARRGRRVMLVDADPQGGALDWSASRQAEPLFPVIGLPRPNLHYDRIILPRYLIERLTTTPANVAKIAQAAVTKIVKKVLAVSSLTAALNFMPLYSKAISEAFLSDAKMRSIGTWIVRLPSCITANPLSIWITFPRVWLSLIRNSSPTLIVDLMAITLLFVLTSMAVRWTMIFGIMKPIREIN